ncbi:MAG: aldolase catalytic domain-containing protein [Lachnospiraceae bacterium]|nr:aldolase catalytic domain-containing protein [Lachnospiraceae bacterium]
MNIKLLDCTLRDGGYVNDWEFGRSCIQYIIQRLLMSKIDIIEVGFINENRPFDINRTIFPDTHSVNRAYNKYDKKNTKFFGMIDYGTCGINKVQSQSETCLDGIRIIFKKNNMHNAIQLGRELKSKGYLVALQLVSVTSYTDKDLLEFCDEVNDIEPYAVGIVDTYGLMHKEQAKHYFELLDYNLKPDIAIGYHSHNNFQLAYSNSIEMLEMNTKRDIILDGSAYGMGKSAGNTPTELLAMHVNDIVEKRYDVDQILEIIDACILPIYQKKKWGYNLLYYLAASNDCHPNYIEYLLAKKTLSVKAVNEIVEKIRADKKLNYDHRYIEKVYLEYQAIEVEDESVVELLKSKYGNKDVLLLAPGRSVSSEKEKIQKYMTENNPAVIAVNFIPEQYEVDGIFIGNAKRYGTLTYQLNMVKGNVDVMITSNINRINNKEVYVLNIDKLMDKREAIQDISTAMILNLLVLIGTNNIVMAGFDGYSSKMENSYCGECLPMDSNLEHCERVNKEMAQKIKKLREKISIQFLTSSKYEEL